MSNKSFKITRLYLWLKRKKMGGHIDVLVQDCSISSVLAMEILQSCLRHKHQTSMLAILEC